MVEDGVLQAHQLRSRVDTDLVAQHGAGDFDRSQGVDRPPGPVQREGELGPAPLAEGLGRHGVGQRCEPSSRGLPRARRRSVVSSTSWAARSSSRATV